MDDTKLIIQLLKRTERKDLDFKSVPIIINDDKHKAKFIKNLICMANTPRDASAFIVSGVASKPDGTKEIVGISDSEHPDDADLQGIIAAKVNPIPEFDYRPVKYENTSLGILEIHPRRGGPFMPRDEYPNFIKRDLVYFRRGSQNAIATLPEIREILAWMDAKQPTLKYPKIIEATNIDVGGSVFDYPCFFPSISSLRTQLNPLAYLQILKASTYPCFLISAYDLYHSKDDRNEMENLLEQASNRKSILLDSGYYESSWKVDDDWTEDKYWEVLRSCDFSFAFSFDKKGELKATAEDGIIKEVISQWVKDPDATDRGNIIPIIHSEPDKFPNILRGIAQKINPVMLAVPERELGDGIFATAKTIFNIREALNQTGTYYPIHLLGTGNPLSILVYTICGANSFDGLEWCQMVINHDTALPYHLQHYDFFDCQSDWHSIHGYSRDLAALTHNLAFYYQWMEQIREAIRQGQAISLLQDFLPIVRDKNSVEKHMFNMLKEQLPALFVED